MPGGIAVALSTVLTIIPIGIGILLGTEGMLIVFYFKDKPKKFESPTEP